MAVAKERKISEKEIETYLCKQVKEIGGKAYKWVSPGNIGVPDRIVIFPNGKIMFVELKSQGNYLTPLQANKIEELRKLKQDVYILNSKALVEGFIKLGLIF
jgi:hypothetical protein